MFCRNHFPAVFNCKDAVFSVFVAIFSFFISFFLKKLYTGDFYYILSDPDLRYDLVQFEVVRDGQLYLYVIRAVPVIVGDIEVPYGCLEGIHGVENLVYDG